VTLRPQFSENQIIDEWLTHIKNNMLDKIMSLIITIICITAGIIAGAYVGSWIASGIIFLLKGIFKWL